MILRPLVYVRKFTTTTTPRTQATNEQVMKIHVSLSDADLPIQQQQHHSSNTNVISVFLLFDTYRNFNSILKWAAKKKKKIQTITSHFVFNLSNFINWLRLIHLFCFLFHLKKKLLTFMWFRLSFSCFHVYFCFLCIKTYYNRNPRLTNLEQKSKYK